MADTFTLNRHGQIGAETVIGTAVAASKQLNLIGFDFTEQPDVSTYNAIGERYDAGSISNRNWTDVAWKGQASYEELQYPISSMLGASATVVTPGGGTISKKWVWTPALSGSITPKSMTLQQGDAIRAQQVAGVVTSGLTLKSSRTSTYTDLTGTAVGQVLGDAATLTTTPTLLLGKPLVSKAVNVYYDTTSAGIGGTQLTRVFSVEIGYTNAYGVFWALNRGLTSWTAPADMAPKFTIKLKLMADSNGMALLADSIAQTIKYLRIDWTGDIIEAAIHYELTIDAAVIVKTPSAAGDEQGAWAKDFELDIVRDTAWGSGTSSIWTLVNTAAAL